MEIEIIDYTGKKVNSFSKQAFKGRDYINFNANGLPAGIYFYSLKVNGKLSDSKKMTIIN